MQFQRRKLARGAAAALAAAGVALVVAALRIWPLSQAPDPPVGAGAHAVALSLLAVGDTGDQHWLPSLREGQRSVARGMRAEDRRRPVDALVLLGDNFYPRGLPADAIAARVRDNLALPFCHFAELAGPRSHELADACDLDAAERHPVPIYAVLGNHDYELPESPELQKRAVVQFVSNWRMPDGLVAVEELGSGVSLILFDSVRVRREKLEAEVRAAIARARGPWRILAAHHPAAPQRKQLERGESALAERLSVPGAPVQLYLSGHLHNLEVIEGHPPGPALYVVAGGGSTIHPLEHDYPDRRFALEQTGFARVDLVRDASGERLVASLYAMPRYPIVFWPGPELVARWSVDADGGLEQQIPAPPP